MTMDAALDRVARDLDVAAPVLAEEVRETVRIMQTIDPGAGYESLYVRLPSPAVRTVVGVLRQGERRGAEIAPSLRAIAANLRAERLARAKDAAGKAQTRMTAIMAAAMFAGFFIIIGGPLGVMFQGALTR
jgi:tight adherence protein C